MAPRIKGTVVKGAVMKGAIMKGAVIKPIVQDQCLNPLRAPRACTQNPFQAKHRTSKRPCKERLNRRKLLSTDDPTQSTPALKAF